MSVAALVLVLALTGQTLANDFLWDAPGSSPSGRPHPPLGERPMPKSEFNKNPRAIIKPGTQRAASNLPANFDSAKQWPQCKSIRTIRNQGPCGTCWAVAAEAVLSDRLCIVAGKTEYVSSNQAAGCVFPEQTPMQNCKIGGWSQAVFKWAAMEGIPSGGEYNSGAGCIPYTVPPIPDNSEQVPITCASTCTNQKFKGKLEEDSTRHQVDSYWTIPQKDPLTQAEIDANVAFMKEDMFKNGPIATRMDMWHDFYDWKKEDGPYTGPKPGAGEGGGHAIRLTGWGTTKEGMKYWIVANSWGTTFGDKGFFWMEMGKNLLGIEASPSAPIIRYNSTTVCKKEMFCDSLDQIIKMDYKDPKSPTFLFSGECIVEVKQDAATKKLSLVGEPTYIARTILNAPKPPIGTYQWLRGALGIFNRAGELANNCNKTTKATKWICEVQKYDREPWPYAVTATGVTYSYEKTSIYVGHQDGEAGTQPIDGTKLFSEPSMPKVGQFLDIDGTQMYVFGKGPKGKLVAGIVSYPKDPSARDAEFKWTTKPGVASKFLTC